MTAIGVADGTLLVHASIGQSADTIWREKLGSLLLSRFLELKWIARIEGTRTIRVTQRGQEAFRDRFGAKQLRLSRLHFARHPPKPHLPPTAFGSSRTAPN